MSGGGLLVEGVLAGGYWPDTTNLDRIYSILNLTVNIESKMFMK